MTENKNDITIVLAQIRENFGSKESRKLRRNGLVPAKLFNPKTGEVIFLSLESKNIFAMTGQKNFLGKKIKVSIDGDIIDCSVTDFDMHAFNLSPLHVELTMLFADNSSKSVFKIPILFKGYNGSAPHKNGERLNIIRRFVEISMPANADSYFEKIVIDISASESGQKFRVSDLDIPSDCIVQKMKPYALLAGFIGRRSGAKSDKQEESSEGEAVG